MRQCLAVTSSSTATPGWPGIVSNAFPDLLINVGVMTGQISMVYAEKYIGFWLAYTLPTTLFLLCPIIMFLCRKRYAGRKPTGSVLGKFFRLLGYAIKHRKDSPNGKFSWEVAKPSKVQNKPKWMTFDDAWVDQVRRGLKVSGDPDFRY
jgi:proton-dependent oligopeptide transporter, POT family